MVANWNLLGSVGACIALAILTVCLFSISSLNASNKPSSSHDTGYCFHRFRGKIPFGWRASVSSRRPSLRGLLQHLSFTSGKLYTWAIGKSKMTKLWKTFVWNVKEEVVSTCIGLSPNRFMDRKHFSWPVGRSFCKTTRYTVSTRSMFFKVACTSGLKCLCSLVNYFKEISSTFLWSLR